MPHQRAQRAYQDRVNGQVTLAAAIRRAAGMEERDLVTVTFEGGTITIVPKRLADKSQASFWSAAWQ